MDHGQRLRSSLVFIALTVLAHTATCEWMEARLVDGNTPAEGRLEIKISDASRVLASMDQISKWVTICDDKWRRAESLVACRMLGYHNSSAVRFGSASDGGGGIIGNSISFPAGKGEIFSYHIKCTGNEGMLTQCQFEARGHCTKHEDVSLQCAKLASTITTTKSTTTTTTAAPPVKFVPPPQPAVALASRRYSRPPAPERPDPRAQQLQQDYDKLRRDYEQQQLQLQQDQHLQQRLEQLQRRLHEVESTNAQLLEREQSHLQLAARLQAQPQQSGQDPHVAAALHRTHEVMLSIARDAAASASAASSSADNVQTVAKDLSAMKQVVHELHKMVADVSNKMPTNQSSTSSVRKPRNEEDQPNSASSKVLLESALLILDQTRVLENITLLQQDELEALVDDVDKKHEQVLGTLNLLLQVMAGAGLVALLVILGLMIFCCCMARKQKQMTSAWGTAAHRTNRKRYDTTLTHAEEGDSLYGRRSSSTNTLNTIKPDKIVRLNNQTMSTSV